MEYNNIMAGVIGIAGLCCWSLEYWNVLKKPELYLPRSKRGKSASISRIVIYVIGVVAWILLSISLTQPRKPLGRIRDEVEVNDIYFVVDVSRSMLAEDFTPNRLEVAKLKIREFVDLNPTERIGLVIFSEKAFTLLPISTDLELIRKLIDEISIGFLGSGTNIGDALGLAVARAAQSFAKNKVIILLTDGVSNVGSMTPIQAAEEARKQNIKVYSIGIGGDKDARIPIGQGSFGKRYQSIPGGSIDLESLRNISEITNGKEYLAKDASALKRILDEIQSLEKSKVESPSRVIYNELYLRYLVWGALMFLLVEVLRKLMLREAK